MAPNTSLDPLNQPRQFLEQLFAVAVRSALPSANMAQWLPAPPKGRTLVLGAGKASAAMAQALDALWPADAPLSGCVVTRYGHTPPLPAATRLRQRIDIVEAAHPVPDAAGLQAAQRIMGLTQGLTADDLVVCLISGGGSSLLTLPTPGLSLADKQRINKTLLQSGATIGEMNCVRKHLSAIKGGRLAAACGAAQVLTLAISDVPGDDLSTIASGPTVADPGTCAQAVDVVRRYGVELPIAILDGLRCGALETPKPGDPVWQNHRWALVATPQQALEAAAQAARAAGLEAHILSDDMEGESREVGIVQAALARAVATRGQPFKRPCVLLSGGETTVTIRALRSGEAPGRGGRAGEFCLGLVQGLRAHPGVFALAADTDGIDGVEDNAGAFVAPDTAARGQSLGLDLNSALDRNDAYGYFSALGALVMTGPTYTNVNDFRAILVL